MVEREWKREVRKEGVDGRAMDHDVKRNRR